MRACVRSKDNFGLWSSPSVSAKQDLFFTMYSSPTSFTDFCLTSSITASGFTWVPESELLIHMARTVPTGPKSRIWSLGDATLGVKALRPLSFPVQCLPAVPYLGVVAISEGDTYVSNVLSLADTTPRAGPVLLTTCDCPNSLRSPPM